MWEPGADRSIVKKKLMFESKVPPPPPPKHLKKKYHKLENEIVCHQNEHFAADPAAVYDPVFNDGRPNKPPPPKPPGNNIQTVREQVDGVADIARQNVQKVLKREDRLNDLDERSHALHTGAKVFVNNAGKLKRKVWWRNFKMWMIIGIALITIIFIIVVSIVSA